MAFDAQQRKIYDIFAGDFKYVIPRYQRKYVWEEKQWRELLDDIKYCIEVDVSAENESEWSHFLGSFVFEKDQKNMIVIDGQQRMTTITLMLCAICVLFNEMGAKDRFKGVVKYILGTDDLGQDFSRVDNQDLTNFQLIIGEATNYNEMQNKSKLFNGSYLEDAPKDNINVKRCFQFFYSQFQDMIQGSQFALNNIKDKIIGLDVIDIKATNQQESYNIFEILNARGVDLKQHELIKNYVFKYILPRASIDTAKLKWDSMEKMLFINQYSVLEQFFTHYVAHRFEKPLRDNTEFRIIKAHCPQNNMAVFLEDLYSKAKIYRWFYFSDECENLVIRTAIQFFSNNNHRQFRPVFMSILSAVGQNKIRVTIAEKFFIFIQNFYFAYGMVGNGKSNMIEDMVYNYARKIENELSEEPILELMDKLRSYYPPFDQFKTMFKLLGYSNKVKSYKTASKKKDVKYILKNIENYYQGGTNELNVNDFSLEHIANDDGAEAHCRIGNLLPIAEPLNNNAGDQTFNKKIEHYKCSNFITVKKFVERYGCASGWNEQDIDRRAEHMAKLAYEEIWKLD